MGNNPSQPSPSKAELCLPQEVLHLIVREIAFSQIQNASDEEVRAADMSYNATNHIKLGFDVDGNLYEEGLSKTERQHSWDLGHSLLFPGVWPEGFFSHSWISSTLQLGCTVRLSSSGGLVYLADALTKQPKLGSFISCLVMLNRIICNSDTAHWRFRTVDLVAQMLPRLPALKALLLRGCVADVALASCNPQEWSCMFPLLVTLYLEADGNSVLDLASLPASLTSITVKRITQLKHDRPFNYPNLQRLNLGVNSWRRVTGLSSLAEIPALRTLIMEDLADEDVRAVVQALGPQLSEFHIDLTKQNRDKLPPWLFNTFTSLTTVVIIGTCNRDILSCIPNTVQSFKWLASERGDLKTATEVMECLSTSSTLPKLKTMPYIALEVFGIATDYSRQKLLDNLLEDLFPTPKPTLFLSHAPLPPLSLRGLSEAQRQQAIESRRQVKEARRQEEEIERQGLEIERQAQAAAFAALREATRAAIKHLRDERGLPESDPADLNFSYVPLWHVLSTAAIKAENPPTSVTTGGTSENTSETEQDALESSEIASEDSDDASLDGSDAFSDGFD